MFNIFKHKIALLLFLVFITRIMCVQIGIFYLAGEAQNKSVVQSLITTVDQKHPHVETNDQLKSGNYWAMELLEADSDAGSKFKPFIIPVLLMLLAFSLAAVHSISRFYLFARAFSFASQQRFLALRVIRI